MIVKLNKCHNCGILRDSTISGECAVCGCQDFTQVLFCDKHHAEAQNGSCEYCLNEQKSSLRIAGPKTKIKQPPKRPEIVLHPVPPPVSRPKPTPISKPRPRPQPTVPPIVVDPAPVPNPEPRPTAPPVVQTEKSGMGCRGCLFLTFWILVGLFIVMMFLGWLTS